MFSWLLGFGFTAFLSVIDGELQWISSPSRAWRLVLTCYLAGGLIASAGAGLDPRGAYAILHDAVLSSFGSAIGMLEIPRRLPRARIVEKADIAIQRSAGWIAAAAAVSIFYIFVLGRGIRVTL